MNFEIITKYFPNLTDHQTEQFKLLYDLYVDWNSKINVVSRKDIESLYEKHVLHSLAIAKYIQFEKGTKILDIGTGGGFPGIPLAILFPDTEFTLCDSVAKKIKVAEEISKGTGLNNTDFVVGRVENLKEEFHFILSRAVAPMESLYRWTQDYIAEDCFNSKLNGYLFLKGGDLKEEIKDLKRLNAKLHVQTADLNTFFEGEFFETKQLVYIFKN
ncbi:MAG: 16S rRNA (guanine(527)-N(7))-methyltransferase RsmG [Bacteroidia bacterium]|nr:16S rRNA (guanine(527)-N(7))-methyltransferase RsmG [Bacteroidia bacterium]